MIRIGSPKEAQTVACLLKKQGPQRDRWSVKAAFPYANGGTEHRSWVVLLPVGLTREQALRRIRTGLAKSATLLECDRLPRAQEVEEFQQMETLQRKARGGNR